MIDAVEASNALKLNVDNLSPKDRDFANSLLQQAAKRSLSEKQLYWVRTLAERSQAKAAPVEVAPTVQVGSVAGIVALFDKAKAAGKDRVSMLLLTSSGETIRLAVASDSSRMPGTINVTTKGSFEDRKFFGRITRDGEFIPHRDMPTPADLLPAITDMANNPEASASLYGRQTGACCFCGIKLTDMRSVSVGYGPECASNYSLPWG